MGRPDTPAGREAPRTCTQLTHHPKTSDERRPPGLGLRRVYQHPGHGEGAVAHPLRGNISGKQQRAQPSPACARRSIHGVATEPSHAASPNSKPSFSYRLPNNHPPPSEQPFVDSKEDQNSVGECPASDAKIEAQKARVLQWTQPGSPGHEIFCGPDNTPRMCILDGFLLYSPPKLSAVMEEIDIKLFLQVSRAKASQRREARDGYVTLEGFWKDPPGYVDKVVWPNYVDAHRWLFAGGDVERGELDWDVLRGRNVLAQRGRPGPGGGVDLDFEETLEWAVGEVMAALERWHKG